MPSRRYGRVILPTPLPSAGGVLRAELVEHVQRQPRQKPAPSRMALKAPTTKTI
jgi:hypothetical protein